MNELQSAVDTFPFWKAILWCFYPMSILILLELFASSFNDDDDQDGGKMIPVYQGSYN